MKLLIVGGFVALAVAGCSATDDPAVWQNNATETTTSKPLPPPYTVSISPAPLYTPPTPSPTAKPSPKPKPVATHKPTPKATTHQAPPSPPPVADVYYPNCAAARAAGAAPLYQGDPGYRSGLDRDHDGVACE